MSAQKTKEKAPTAVAPSITLTADQLKEKGNAAFVAKKYDEAVAFFSQALQKDPQNAALYSNRSGAYMELHKPHSALQDADTAVQLKPDWPKAYLRRGIAFEGMFQYPEAFEAYTKGLTVDPEDKALKSALAELQKVLDELKITEKQLAGNANPELDRFERMIRWLKESGARFPMLYMQYYSEDYRGVHALTKIPADREILYVPLTHIMTSEVAKESDVGRAILAAGVELRSEHSHLAAFLCQEKYNPNSFWRPYIDMLPQRYRNMPIFFTPEELTWLKGSFTLEKIADRREALRVEYENICQGVPAFRRYTLHDFIWGRLVVITRIFGITVKEHKTDGLVPYADMLNHKRPRETGWTFDNELNGFTITALRTIGRGEEVFDSYGRKCNSRFFVNYGFALDENEDNEVVVRVALPKLDPHYAMKVGYLGGEAQTQREFQVPASYREKKTRELFSFLRIIHSRDSELMRFPEDNTKIDDLDPVSVENETAVLKHIAQAAQVVLNGFDTSLEEDLEMLKSSPLMKDANIRNCVVVRVGEKKVLHWFINLAKEVIPMLQQPWKDLKRTVAKAVKGTSEFEYYVSWAIPPLFKKH